MKRVDYQCVGGDQYLAFLVISRAARKLADNARRERRIAEWAEEDWAMRFDFNYPMGAPDWIDAARHRRPEW